MPRPEYSIIMPARNEEKRVSRTLERYARHFRRESFEILVVMNDCTDDTLGVVKRFARRHPQVKYKYLNGDIGKGGAIIEGMKLVTGRLVVYVDADGATPPEAITYLAGRMGSYDGVMGSRWMRGAKVTKKQPVNRMIASRGFNLLIRMILGLPYRDTQCAAKVFRNRVVKDVVGELREKSFAFDACMLFLMKKKGYVVKEVPIEWRHMDSSTLKMRKAIPRMFLAVLKTRLRNI